MSSIISANRLGDGTVVFLTADGWVEALAQAQVYGNKAASDNGLVTAQADEAANLVVDSFVLPVLLDAGTIKPITLRDRIRSQGPTIAYLPAKAANRAA